MRATLAALALALSGCVCGPPTAQAVEQGADTLAGDLATRAPVEASQFGDVRAALLQKLPACILSWVAEHLLAALPAVVAGPIVPRGATACHHPHPPFNAQHRALLDYLAHRR